MAAAMAALLGSAVLAPAAFGLSSGAPGAATAAAAKRPVCKAGKVLVQRKQRVRVTKKVRVHGKLRPKKVWVKKLVWVCVARPAPGAAKDTVAPSAPTGLDAAAGNGQVALVWNPAKDNVGVTGYRVVRDGQPLASPATTQHTDTGLANGKQYTYGVAAVDAAGNVSPTVTIVATPKSGRDVTPPSAPPAFTAAAADRQVALSWGAAGDDVGVVFYELRRDGTPIAFQEGRAFTDTALVNGTAYTYTVLAIDAAGNASPASSVSATPADTVAPSVPAGLAAVRGNGQVSLTWEAATDNVAVTGYRVYRDGVVVASPSTPYFVDTALTNGITYTYRVVAVDGSANASAQTAPVSATPAVPDGSDVTPPATPTNVVGTAGTGQVSLTWAAATDNVGVTGYKVYRGGVLVGTPAGPSFVDTGLVNGTAYTYTIAAVDAAANGSALTAPVSVTPHDTQAPSVPTGLALTKDAAAHSITVTWTASTDNVGVVRYRVYRNGTLIGQPTGTSHADLDLSNGKTYTYTVAAVDAAGNVSAQAPAVSTYVS
jgi:chitodextrinase